MKSLAEAIEANRVRQAKLRAKRARSFTVTSEPGYNYVGASIETIVEEVLARLARERAEGGAP